MAKAAPIPAFTLPGPMHPEARRIEIDEFICDNALTSLFLLALRQMMDAQLKPKGQEDWFSWYNISATHGFPEELWNGIQNTGASNKENGYYCTHGSTVFPTWHRCSLHMMEQAIYRKMTDIASKYEDAVRPQFEEALKRFRFPYWDPLLPRNKLRSLEPSQDELRKQYGVPAILSEQKVWVRAPGIGKLKIDNPLYRFDFPASKEYRASKRTRIRWNYISSKNAVQLPEGTHEDHTLRAPSNEGISQHPELVKRIQGQVQGLAIAMWQLLNPGESDNERKWDKFANHFAEKIEEGVGWDDGVSLEGWHDQVHTLVGVGTGQAVGHMGLLELAAFDPIFWLHHNNVERLFALYQALYDEATSTYVAKEIVAPNKWGLDSPIQPFTNGKLDEHGNPECYTSENVRNWRLLGYGVPGVSDVDDAQRTIIAKYIRDTYYWITSNSPAPEGFPYPKDQSKVYALTGDDTLAYFSPPPTSFTELSAADGLVKRTNPVDADNSQETLKTGIPISTIEEERVEGDPNRVNTWNANIHVQKYAFNQSFEVHLFLEDYITRTDPNWFKYPNEIGYTAIFASTPETDCDNCADMMRAKMIYTDVISLGTILPLCLESNDEPDDVWPALEMRTLKDLSAESVLPFLSERLKWRMRLPNQDEKTEEDMKSAGLSVTVCSRTFTIPSEEKPLGVYGDTTPHPEVTRGKAGGSDVRYEQGIA